MFIFWFLVVCGDAFIIWYIWNVISTTKKKKFNPDNWSDPHYRL